MKRSLNVRFVTRTFGFLVLLLLVSSCGNTPTAETASTDIPIVAEAAQTSTPVPAEPTEVPAEPTVAPTPTQTPLECTIAFETDRDGNSEIYRMGPDGSDVQNLTNHEAYDYEPAWSPDGSQIAFISDRPVDGQAGGNTLWIMDEDGSNQRQLTFGSSANGNDSRTPNWSRDGKLITYSAWGDIFVVPADGSGPPTFLTNNEQIETKPRFSPDGSKILFISEQNGQTAISVMNSDGTDPKQITFGGHVQNAQWTIDGEIFSNWEQPDGICGNCVLSTDGSNIRNAGGKGEVRNYVPFKNKAGEKVEIANIDLDTGDEEIYVIDVNDPGIFINLTNNPATDRSPAWPADCLRDFGGAPAVLPTAEIIQPSGGGMIGFVGEDPADPRRAAKFDQACKELGINCQHGSLTDLMATGVGAIVVNSIDGTPLESPEGIEAAIKNGVKVILIGAELDIPGLINVTSNPDRVVETGLKFMLDTIGGTGKVMIFDVAVGYHNAEKIDSLLANYPNINVVARDEGGKDYDQFWIKPRTADYLRADPDVKVIWTNTGWELALQGMKDESGLAPGNWPAMMCEPTNKGLDIWKELLKVDPDFQCMIVSIPPSVGYEAAILAYHLLNGAEINPNLPDGKYGNSISIYVDPVIVGPGELEATMLTNPDVDLWISQEEIRSMWLK